LFHFYEMAAHEGVRGKIIRVSMPFERSTNSTKKMGVSIPQKRLTSRYSIDPRSVVLKVHSWATQLSEGRVRSRAEIARREGITRARVSQLWPLSEIAREQADEGLKASKLKRNRLRGLIQIARNLNLK
jgi:hypothetical protein